MQPLQDATIGTIAIAGRRVRRLGFGAARVSGARDLDGRRDRQLARQLCQRAYDRGINFIDVASVYGRGECEEIIAEALYPYPADLLIASKAGMAAFRNDAGRTVTAPDGRPEFIRAECERSLRRLRLDHIDLYQIHSPDPSVPWSETVGAFALLQQAGHIGHIGLSNVSVEQLDAATAIAPIASVQNLYNVGVRSSEPVLEACEQRGIPFIPYSPNLLGDSPAVAVVADIAATCEVSAPQIQVAWVLARSPMNLPIPGTTSLAHVDDNVDSAWLNLSEEQLARLDAAGATER